MIRCTTRNSISRRAISASQFDTTFGRIGVLVCWDQWYPEAARLTALAGAEILLYPTAIGWHPDDVRTEEPSARRLGVEPAWPRGRQWPSGAVLNRVGHETRR